MATNIPKKKTRSAKRVAVVKVNDRIKVFSSFRKASKWLDDFLGPDDDALVVWDPVILKDLRYRGGRKVIVHFPLMTAIGVYEISTYGLDSEEEFF